MRAKFVNEEVIKGSIWRSANQKWLLEFLSRGGYIHHGTAYISFSFDTESGGMDNFGGREIVIEFDEQKILRQGREQGLGEIYYDEGYFEENPDISNYVTGYNDRKSYEEDNDDEYSIDWETYIEDFEHEKEILLKELHDEEGLIKQVIFNEKANPILLNKLIRMNIPYKLKQGVKDTQKELELH